MNTKSLVGPGVETMGVRPCASIFATTSGLARLAPTAALSLLTISGGVPFGAVRPTHEVTVSCLWPSSSNVGTSGRSLLRCALDTAQGLAICAATQPRNARTFGRSRLCGALTR